MATLNLYRVRIFDQTGHVDHLLKLEEVPGSRLTDVDVVSFEPPEESVEIEAGRFEIGNATFIVRGVAEDYFASASDDSAPYIAEVMEGGTCLFWGLVPQAHFDRKTERTNFTALSPEYLLKSVNNLPARAQFEVETPRWVLAEDGFIHIYVDNTTPVSRGDVVAMELATGQYRAPVEAVVNGLLNVPTIIILPASIEDVTVYGADLDSITVSDSTSFVRILAADVGDLISVFPPDTEGSGGIQYANLSGDGWFVKLYDATGDQIVQVRLNRIQYDLNGDAVLTIAPNYPSLFADAVSLEVIKPASVGSESQTITILDRGAWGYSPSLDANVRDDYYEIETLIQALLSVGYTNTATEIAGRPLGLFPWFVRNITVQESFDLGKLSIMAEFDDNPLGALRELQIASKSLIRFNPVVDAGIPRIDVEVIPRTLVSDTQTAIAASGVIDWTEAETPRRVKAVVVRSNADYFQPDSDVDVLGMWFESADGAVPQHTYDGDVRTVLTEDERTYRGVPSGDGVIELEVPIIPAYSGTEFGGSSILNDDMLVSVAEYYYKWFNEIAREVTGTLFARDPSILGKIISVSEGEGAKAFSSSVFVTRVSPSLSETRTDFSGYILPTFIPPAASVPTAVIQGALVYLDRDASGNEDIALSGSASYNPSGNGLTYAWEVDTGSGYVQVQTGAILEYTMPAGRHLVRLTVTDPVTALFDTEVVTVSVVDPPDLPSDEDDEGLDPRGYDSEQWEDNGVGYVRLYPNSPSFVSQVRWRKTTGQELQEIDWGAFPDPAHWYTQAIKTPPFSTNARGDYFLFDVNLDERHLSYIECYIEFTDGTTPQVARFAIDADIVADFSSANLSIDQAGNVYATVQGDTDTLTTNGVRIATLTRASGVAPPAPGDYGAGTLYNNPVISQLLQANLAAGLTLYAKVELLNRTDGLVGATTYLGATNNTYDGGGSADFVVFADKERGDFSSPIADGLLFFDSTDPVQGLNLRYSGVWATVWDSENDGTGSGLDADLWDGNQFASFLNQGVRTTDNVTHANITGTGLATIQGGLTVNNGGLETGTKAFKIVRNANADENLTVFVTALSTVFDSCQEDVSRIGGGYIFRQTNKTTDVTLTPLLIDGAEARATFGYNQTDYRLGINKNVPVSELHLDGTMTLEGDLVPLTNYTGSIGRIDKQFLSIFAAELTVNTLVSQETRATVGGSLLVTHSSVLIDDMPSGSASMYTKHNSFNPGDILQLHRFDGTSTQIEFIEIVFADGAATAGNGNVGFHYVVTRDLDATGSNNWLEGDSLVSTGNKTTGGGFIHLFANTSLFNGAQLSGPTIVFNERTGAAYNAVEARAAVGNLDGYYGVSTDVFGFGAGSPTEYLRVLEDEISMVSAGVEVFRVDNAGLFVDGYGEFSGTVYASAGTFTGTITASAGNIGGWLIGASSISREVINDRITINSTNRSILGEEYIGTTWYTTFKISAQQGFDARDSLISTIQDANTALLEYGSASYTTTIVTSTMPNTQTWNAEYGYKIVARVTPGGADIANYDLMRFSGRLQGYDGAAWVTILDYGLFGIYEVDTGGGVQEFAITEIVPTGYTKLRVQFITRGHVYSGSAPYYGELGVQVVVYETVDKFQLTSEGMLISATDDSFIEFSRTRAVVAGRDLMLQNSKLRLEGSAIVDTSVMQLVSPLVYASADFEAEGSIVGASKSFKIPHPDPQKNGVYDLYHRSIEAPTAGETVQTFRVHVGSGLTGSVQIPDYWHFLNANPRAWVQPVDTLGVARADLDGETLTVTATIPGYYDVLLIGTRIDPGGLKGWNGAEVMKTA